MGDRNEERVERGRAIFDRLRRRDAIAGDPPSDQEANLPEGTEEVRPSSVEVEEADRDTPGVDARSAGAAYAGSALRVAGAAADQETFMRDVRGWFGRPVDLDEKIPGGYLTLEERHRPSKEDEAEPNVLADDEGADQLDPVVRSVRPVDADPTARVARLRRELLARQQAEQQRAPADPTPTTRATKPATGGVASSPTVRQRSPAPAALPPPPPPLRPTGRPSGGRTRADPAERPRPEPPSAPSLDQLRLMEDVRKWMGRPLAAVDLVLEGDQIAKTRALRQEAEETGLLDTHLTPQQEGHLGRARAGVQTNTAHQGPGAPRDAAANTDGPGGNADTVKTPGGSSARPPRPEAVSTELPRVLAVANQKGGVGKTTTSVNLSAALAELGYRVLVVDLDPQGNATTGLGVDARNLAFSVYDVIMRDTPVDDCLEPTRVKNLFLVPATIDLAGAEVELVPAFSRELKLKRGLAAVAGEFDFTLIDCPPSLGLLTVNGLAAANEVVVPIQCEYYALEGVGQLLRNVALVKSNLNPDLEVSTIILTMFDARTKLADQVANEVRAHFGPKVCRNVVPRSVRLSEAPSYGQPITVFDPSSRGAIAYRELAKEVSGGAPQRTR